MLDATHAIVSWYAGDLQRDDGWAFGMLQPTSIWVGTVDFTKLQ
jgi:hypothetical protein